MTYSLDEKTAAVERGELWWRFPTSRHAQGREWSLLSDDFPQPYDVDLQREDDRIPAEYHIGPTAPVVLTELERELLAALNQSEQELADAGHDGCQDDAGCRVLLIVRAAIAKATGGQP